MVIQWVQSAVGFDDLGEEWNRLLAGSSSDSLFLTWEWLRTWWSHFSTRRELRILTVRQGGELVAVAPLTVRPGFARRYYPFAALEFLGAGTIGSDYLDLIVRKDAGPQPVDVLSRTLGRVDSMIEFGQLRADGSVADNLRNRIQQDGWKSARTIVNTCPFISLRGHTWESYLGSLSSEHRYAFQRKRRTLSKRFEVSFERVETEAQRRDALQTLISLHQQRWSERGDASDAFHTPAHLAFHEEFSAEALRRGWLRLFLLRLNGQAVSALYGFRYGRTFYFFQSGFNPDFGKHGVGVVTMGMAIESAILEGADEFDMLHGAEPYKFHWAKQSRDLARVEMYPPGLRGWCFRLLSGGIHTAGAWARRNSATPALPATVPAETV